MRKENMLYLIQMITRLVKVWWNEVKELDMVINTERIENTV